MHPLTAAAALLTPAAGLYAASWIAEVRGLHDWLVPGAMWRTTHRHIVLSFDDGPDPERTPRLLDVLAAAEVKAVFFVIGKRVAKHPAIVRRMATDGHQIGNHSWSHRWLPGVSAHTLAQQIDRCQRAVEDVTGTAPLLARPPYGMRDFRYYRALAERGMTPVLWSRNLRDYHRAGVGTLLRRLSRAQPGEIVLCHDGDPLAPHTVNAVEQWLDNKPPPIGLI